MRSLGYFLFCLFALVVSGCDQIEEGEWTRRVDVANQKNDLKQLEHFLDQPLAVVRTRAIYHLARRKGKRALMILRNFTKQSSVVWRREILVALLETNRQDQAMNMLLADYCLENDIELRMATLVELGHRDAMSPQLWQCMIKNLQHPSPILNRVTYLALRQQNWRTLPALGKALQRKKIPKKQRKAIIHLLTEITGVHWHTKKQWQRWFKQGLSKLFILRYTGQWPRDKSILKRALLHRNQLVRKEAARILSRIAPLEEGLQLLIKSQRPSNLHYAPLWGMKASQRLLAKIKRSKHTVTEQDIRSLGAMLPPSQYAWLLSMLSPTQLKTPKQQKRGLAILDILMGNAQLYGAFTPDVLNALERLLKHPQTKLAQAAGLSLWYGSDWNKEIQTNIRQAFKSTKNAKETKRLLHVMGEIAAWTRNYDLVKELMSQLHHKHTTTYKLELLNVLTEVGNYLPVSSAATHAFAWAMKQPHLFGESSFQLLLHLPPQDRYGWFVLLYPVLETSQWKRIFRDIRNNPKHKSQKPTKPIEQLLRKGLSQSIATPARKEAIKTIAYFRWKMFLPLLLKLVHRTKHIEEKLILVRAIGAIGTRKDNVTQTTLRNQMKQTENPVLRWEISVSQLRCGDKRALEWLRLNLRLHKGTIWDAPKRLIPALIEAKQIALIATNKHKLQHLSISALDAAIFVHSPNEKNLFQLVHRLTHPLESKKERSWTLNWLQSHAKKLFVSLQKYAKDLEQKQQILPALKIVQMLTKARTSTLKKEASQLLNTLSKQTKLSQATRYIASLLRCALQQEKVPIPDATCQNLMKRPIQQNLTIDKILMFLPAFQQLQMQKPIQRYLRIAMTKKQPKQQRSKARLLHALLQMHLTPKERQETQRWAKQVVHENKQIKAFPLYVLALSEAKNGQTRSARRKLLQALHLTTQLEQRKHWSQALHYLFRKSHVIHKQKPASRPAPNHPTSTPTTPRSDQK